MSEFSESYHLRGMTRNEAAGLLRRAGIAGYVLPVLDGWVSFVAEGPAFEPNARLLAANPGVLLRWTYADDHAWGFEVYDGAEPQCGYACFWDEQLVIEGDASHTQLRRLLGLPLSGLAGEAGRRILQPRSIDDVRERKPAYAFAAALGLTHYRWLAWDYLHADAARGHPLPPGTLAIA